MTALAAAGGRPGYWAIAGTPTSWPYPCLCPDTATRHGRHCPCRGRTDLDNTPGYCCARRPALRAVT